MLRGKEKLLLGLTESTVRQMSARTQVITPYLSLLTTGISKGESEPHLPMSATAGGAIGDPGEQQGRRWKSLFRCPERRQRALCILEKTRRETTSLQPRGKPTQLLSVYPKPFPIFSFVSMCQKLTFLQAPRTRRHFENLQVERHHEVAKTRSARRWP